MARIFVSFRNGDEEVVAGLIADALAQRFGAEQVFRSSESIIPGDDFVKVLESQIEQCEVLLAVIGDRWLTVADSSGKPKIRQPGDWVRWEISAALDGKKRVIPLLIGDASLPADDDLPSSIRELARCQYMQIRGRDVQPMLAHLIDILAALLVSADPAAPGVPELSGVVKLRDAYGDVTGLRIDGEFTGTAKGRVQARDVRPGASVVGATYDSGHATPP